MVKVLTLLIILTATLSGNTATIAREPYSPCLDGASILFVDAEVQYIEAVLQQNAIPITEAQRYRMLEILIDVQNQELTLPGADAERGSIEYLEYRLAEMDERQRLVLEQAASVLSAEQVRYMFERNQQLSYQRADALEAQQKARADEPTEDLPLWYPGRTD